ncbi:hypothetical protein Tco_1567563 [Tanacetum coccineum]
MTPHHTIMVEGLESTGRNLVAIVRDVYVFRGSFTYVMDFVVLEDKWEFIVSDMANVVLGRPFRVVSQLEYDCVKGIISFSRIFDFYTKFYNSLNRAPNRCSSSIGKTRVGCYHSLEE